MKTIDIKSGDSIAQFTTKSVTVEGKEYFYSNMSEVTHLPEKQAYCFSYEGKFHALPYEAKDSKVLGAIFGQVQSMSIQAQQNASQPQQDGQAGQPQQAEQNSQTADTQTPQTVENSAASTEAADVSDKGSNDAVDAVKADGKTDGTDSKVNKASTKTDKASAKADKARDKAEKKAAKKAEKEKKKSEKPGKSDKPEKKEKTPMDAEKKNKLKRSLIIFGLIVIIIAAIAVIYGAIFGTSSAPSPLNPNSNESQQYDEIDQLINDLQ